MKKPLIPLSCLIFLTTSLFAQVDLQKRPQLPAPYVLGPGDAIALHVDDVEEIPVTPITIDPGGFVDLPMAGRVQAAGLTLTQFNAELVAKYSQYITAPKVSTNLVQSGSEPVSVVGQVNLPGVHQLAGSKHLLEVISLSGGLKPDAGPSVIVTREPRWGTIQAAHTSVDPATGDSTATFSLDDLMSGKSPQDNIQIEPNDVVSVPRAELVYVLGDVKKAGGFQLSTHPTISLLEALTMAEGLGPDDSAKNARILRQEPGGDGVPRQIPVNVNKIVAGKAPDVQLHPNDVLYIPHSGSKVIARRAIEAAVGVSTGILIYR